MMNYAEGKIIECRTLVDALCIQVKAMEQDNEDRRRNGFADAYAASAFIEISKRIEEYGQNIGYWAEQLR